MPDRKSKEKKQIEIKKKKVLAKTSTKLGWSDMNS